MIDLKLGDCLVEMKSIKEKTIDMVLCDLPYGILNDGNKLVQWDMVIPFQPLWDEYRRLVKDTGVIILFGQGMFTAQLMLSAPDLWRYNLIWDKNTTTGFLNANRMPLRRHEDILVFYKSLPVYHPQMDILKRPKKVNGHSQKNSCYGTFKENYSYSDEDEMKYQKYPDSIISIMKDSTVNIVHPTQKPVSLLRYLIRTYTDEGMVVMDNTMGSGSTGVACVMEKRKFIGIEKEKRYFEIARQRIDEALSNPVLF